MSMAPSGFRTTRDNTNFTLLENTHQKQKLAHKLKYVFCKQVSLRMAAFLLHRFSLKVPLLCENVAAYKAGTWFRPYMTLFRSPLCHWDLGQYSYRWSQQHTLRHVCVQKTVLGTPRTWYWQQQKSMISTFDQLFHSSPSALFTFFWHY